MKRTVFLIIVFFLAAGISEAECVEIQGITKFANPYLQQSFKPIERLELIGVSGEKECLFFVVMNDNDQSLKNVTAELVPAKDNPKGVVRADVFVVKAWRQLGVPVTANKTDPVALLFVPELLIKSDLEPQVPGAWVEGQYRPPALPKKLLTDLPPRGFKEFYLEIAFPQVEREVIFKWVLMIKTGNRVVAKKEVRANTLPITLPAHRKTKAIYFKGNIDRSDPNFCSREELTQQLNDIREHGFNCLVMEGRTAEELTELFTLSRNAGLGEKVVLIYKGDDDAILVEAADRIKTKGGQVFVLGVDEPNSRQKLKVQIERSKKLHKLGLGVYAPLRLEWERKLRETEPVDWANYYFEKSLHLELSHVAKGERGIRTYYWQIYMEAPALNRLLTGFYLYHSKLDGISPYVYRHVFEYDQPWISDLRFMGNRKRQAKDAFQRRKYYYVTYPSKDGPVPTVQWEACGEGDDDLRYCLFLEALVRRLKEKGKEKEASEIERQFEEKLSKLCQFYAANRLPAYQKYEKTLCEELEKMRNWVLHQIKEFLPLLKGSGQ